MPLISCGPGAYKWGASGFCYKDGSPGENKRRAILQGVSYEGSDKVNKMLKHDKGAFMDAEGLALAKSILAEFETDRYNESVARFALEHEKKTADAEGSLNPTEEELAVNNDADLNKRRDFVGVDIIIPPKNKISSPDSFEPVSTYDVPTKEETFPREVGAFLATGREKPVDKTISYQKKNERYKDNNKFGKKD